MCRSWSTAALITIAAVAAVALAGCAAAVPGSAQAGSRVATSSTTANATTIRTSASDGSRASQAGESTIEDTITDETKAEDTDDPATSSTSGLDPVTESWFVTYCTQATDIASYASPDTTGQTLLEAQATVVDAYSNIAISASTSVGILRATPAPPIAGGDDLQTIAVETFSALSDVYGRGALTILGLTPTSINDLKVAIDAIEAEATASVPTNDADVNHDVLDAAKQLPECQDVQGMMGG